MSNLRSSSRQGKSYSPVGRGKARRVQGGARKSRRGDSPPALDIDLAALPGAREAAVAPRLEPQLAMRSSEPPRDDAWLHEIKFDGYRLLARIEGGVVRLVSRNGKDWTARFSRLAEALSELELGDAVLDGEVVALQSDGTSSFRQLQEQLSAKRTSNLIYQVFDLLHVDGYDLSDVELETRKRVLRDLLAGRDVLGRHGTVRYVHHFEGKGEELFGEVCQLGLEGIMSKRRTSRYRAGARSGDWLKIKCVQQGEFVVGGYTDPSNARIGFGALLLGGYTEEGELRYIGSVGSGFSAQSLRMLYRQLRELEVDWPPFVEGAALRGVRGAHWVRPELVADVEFTEWTREGVLRHPVFRGMREDRNPAEIVLGEEVPPAEVLRLDAAPRRSRPAAPARAKGGSDDKVAGVRLTHPDRIVYPQQGVTKLHLARYYEQVAERILPHIARRPLTLMRCPDGREGSCFYQKHPPDGLSDAVRRVEIAESSGNSQYMYVDSLAGIVALVQIGALELHTWGSCVGDVEKPDTLVFDLDPGPGVTWARLIDGARTLEQHIARLGLAAFPKLTGGKGLHLVVPIAPERGFDQAKAFARRVAEGLAREQPDRFTANMAKARRRNRVFIDYLRNGRGATAVCAYSTRARPGAPVAVPITWEELDPASRSDRYGMENVRRRLAALRRDPWADFESSRRSLADSMLEAVGAVGT